MLQSRRVRACIAGACVALAGPAWAGDALVATYAESTAGTRCEFVLLRSDDRAEYRGCGRPTRLWRRLGDGVELVELHPADGHAVRYAPGDLRVLDREPDWSQVTGIASASLRESLGAGRPARVDARAVTRYRGRDPQGRAVALDWLDDAQLPARLQIGGSREGSRLDLRSLAHAADETAFTPIGALREIDAADLGD